jgi:hypothetical protein
MRQFRLRGGEWRQFRMERRRDEIASFGEEYDGDSSGWRGGEMRWFVLERIGDSSGGRGGEWRQLKWERRRVETVQVGEEER